MTNASPTAASAAAIAMEKIAIMTPVGWCGSELNRQKAHALQRPDVIRHQHFTDAFDGERRNFRRGNGKRLRLENRPDQTAKHGNGDDNAAPVEHPIFFDVTPRQ